MRSLVILLAVAGCCLLGVSWAAPRSLEEDDSEGSEENHDHGDKGHYEPLTVEVFTDTMKEVLENVSIAEMEITAFVEKAANKFHGDQQNFDVNTALADLKDEWDNLKSAVIGAIDQSANTVGYTTYLLFNDSSGFIESSGCDDLQEGLDALKGNQTDAERQEALTSALAASMQCFGGKLTDLLDDANFHNYKLYQETKQLDEEQALDVVIHLSSRLLTLYMGGKRALGDLKHALTEGTHVEGGGDSSDESEDSDESGEDDDSGDDNGDDKRILQLIRRLLKEKRGLDSHKGKQGDGDDNKPKPGDGEDKPEGGDKDHSGESKAGEMKPDEKPVNLDFAPYSLKQEEFFNTINFVYIVIAHVRDNFTSTVQTMEAKPEDAVLLWRQSMFGAGGAIQYKLVMLLQVLIHLHYNHLAGEITEHSSCATRIKNITEQLDPQDPEKFLNDLASALEDDIPCFKGIMKEEEAIVQDLANEHMTEQLAVGVVYKIFKDLHLARLASVRFMVKVDAALKKLDNVDNVQVTERELLNLLKKQLDKYAY